MESKFDVYDFWAEEARKLKGDNNYKSDLIREFIRGYGKDMELETAPEYALFTAFVEEYPLVDVTKNYFHTVAAKSWVTTSDPSNFTIVNLDKQKVIKKRNRRQV